MSSQSECRATLMSTLNNLTLVLLWCNKTLEKAIPVSIQCNTGHNEVTITNAGMVPFFILIFW